MMATAKAIEDFERGAYRSRWRDGTLDLCGGLGVLLTGVAWQVGVFWAPGFAVPILIVLWTVMRKRVVEPRIGRVTFGRERREKETGGMKAAIWFGSGLLVLFVVVYALRSRGGLTLGPGDREWSSGLPVGLLGVMALISAAMAGLSRFVGYAAILAATGVVGVMLGLEPAPQMMIGGAVITLIGGILIFRFIAANPVRGEEAAEG